MNTSTHSTTAPAPQSATSNGALAHFASFCSCGFEIRSIFANAVRRDAAEHVAYMAAKDRGPKALRAFVLRGVR